MRPLSWSKSADFYKILSELPFQVELSDTNIFEGGVIARSSSEAFPFRSRQSCELKSLISDSTSINNGSLGFHPRLLMFALSPHRTYHSCVSQNSGMMFKAYKISSLPRKDFKCSTCVSVLSRLLSLNEGYIAHYILKPAAPDVTSFEDLLTQVFSQVETSASWPAVQSSLRLKNWHSMPGLTRGIKSEKYGTSPKLSDWHSTSCRCETF